MTAASQIVDLVGIFAGKMGLARAANMSRDTNMNILVNDISRTSRISADQARLALGAILSFLGARLPSPVMGRIHEALGDDRAGSDNHPPQK
jgi:hypothetical protein